MNKPLKKKSDPALILKKIRISWRKAFSKLSELGGVSSGNSLQIYHHGDEAFASIHQALFCAQKSIFLETYIFAPDKVGEWIRDALIAAAKRGVVVVVVYDHIGSSGIGAGFLQPMHDAGIRILEFNPIWPWRRRGPLLFRDHRKIIVVDESLAFCGSMNIAADYAGPKYGTDRFRDTLARIEGPAVSDLLDITLETIAESEFESPSSKVASEKAKIHRPAKLIKGLQDFFADNKFSVKSKNANGTMVQVLRSNTRRNLTHIQESMELSINRAVKYCYFTTPYFLPYDKLRKAMINAKRRGVDVRILTTGLSDIPLMRYASRHVYIGFLQQGIRIYEMSEKTLHAKIATIDGVHSSIGSYNLDHWSARRNLEVNVSIIDQEIALQLRSQFEADLKLSSEIDAKDFMGRSIFRKFLCWIAYNFFRL